MANPYATDSVSNALDTGQDIAERVMTNARMNEAYDTSVDRWKQIGKDVLFAPVAWKNAPPWEQALALIGGIKTPRWTAAEDAALSRWAKGDGTIPDELLHRSEGALRTRALSQGLLDPQDKYRRQPFAKLPSDPATLGPYSRWTPEEDAALARWIKSDELVIPQELAHRSETALHQRALAKGLRDPQSPYRRARPIDETRKPAGPQPDYLDLAAEPRAAVLFIKSAADGGSLQAKAMMNQLATVAPTKRDPLIQLYIDKLRRGGWKPGMRRGGRLDMRRGGRVPHNHHARAA
jgi:hypothetical protein